MVDFMLFVLFLLVSFIQPAFCQEQLTDTVVQEKIEEGMPVVEIQEINEVEKIKLYPIDKVEAVIFSDEEVKVITSSDVKPSLDNKPRSLDDIISMHVMFNEATYKYKMPIDEQSVDSYLVSLQKQHNLTLEQVKQMFLGAGFTYEQGRQELKMMNANNSLMQFLVNSRLVVSEDMVKQYFQDHPMVVEGSYELQLATVKIPAGSTSKEHKKDVVQFAKTGNGLDVSWSGAFTMAKDDIAEDKKGILALEAGEILVITNLNDFDLFKLVSKQVEKTVPLSERYSTIEMQIKEPLFYQMLDSAKTELIENASIVRPDDAKAVDQFDVIQ